MINNYESVTDNNKIYSDDRVCPPEGHLVGTVNLTLWRYVMTSPGHDTECHITTSVYCPISLVKNMLQT